VRALRRFDVCGDILVTGQAKRILRLLVEGRVALFTLGLDVGVPGDHETRRDHGTNTLGHHSLRAYESEEDGGGEDDASRRLRSQSLPPHVRSVCMNRDHVDDTCDQQNDEERHV